MTEEQDKLHLYLGKKIDEYGINTNKELGAIKTHLSKLNSKTVSARADIDALYKIVSENSGGIALLQETKKKEIAAELENTKHENELYKMERSKWRDRMIFGAILGILFIAIYVGLINGDFVKALVNGRL